MPNVPCNSEGSRLMRLFLNRIRDHPFKTSASFKGEGVKNLPNLLTDSSKKTADLMKEIMDKSLIILTVKSMVVKVFI